MVDWNKELINRFIEFGLTPKEANYLSNSMKDEASYQKDDYARALHRKYTTASAPQSKIEAKEFMDSIRKMNDKPMTTEKFFDKKPDYKIDPGAGKVPDDYMEAIKRQRVSDDQVRKEGWTKTLEKLKAMDLKFKEPTRKLRLVTEDGMANIKSLGANAAAMGLGYLVSKTPDLQLDIKNAGEGSDIIPPDYDSIMRELKVKELMGR